MLKSRFRSRTEHTLDAKGRLNFPRRFCDVLEQLDHPPIIISPWVNHLRIYPIQEWENIENKLFENGGEQPEVLRVVPSIVGGAVDCSLDKQGRILIPQSLRAEIGLQKEIVLNGVVNRVEIWDAAVWADQHKAMKGYGDFAAGLAKIGIM